MNEDGDIPNAGADSSNSKINTSISLNVCKGFTGLTSKITSFQACPHGLTGCTDRATILGTSAFSFACVERSEIRDTSGLNETKS
jgi:hypothetical protein